MITSINPLLAFPKPTEEELEKNKIKSLKHIILQFYPKYPTLKKFRKFVAIRVVCKAYCAAFNDFYPMPSTGKMDKHSRNLLMSKLDAAFFLERGHYHDTFIRCSLIDLKETPKKIIVSNNQTPLIRKHYPLEEMRRAQRFLIEKIGYEQALKLTLSLDKRVNQFAYTAYIYEGCARVNLSPHPSVKEVMEKRHHPFIEILKIYTPQYPLPQPAIEYFLLYIINRALDISSFDKKTTSLNSSTEEEVSMEEVDTTPAPEEDKIRRIITSEWLTLLPPLSSLAGVLGQEDLMEYLNQSV